MSLLKIKQIAVPANSEGATILVDSEGKLGWSTSLSTALTLPSGTSADRPQNVKTGSIRFNSETNAAEIYNGTDWTAVGSGSGSGGARINDEADTTFVDTSLVENHVVAGAFGKNVLEITASETEANAGEKLTITTLDQEVRLSVTDTAGTADVNLRLVPQNEGHVYLGVVGDGIVEADNTYDLIVRGGKATTATTAGKLILRGGEGTGANANGGDTVLAPGKALDGGVAGKITIQDEYDRNFLTFVPAPAGAPNFLEIQNGVLDFNNFTRNAVKLRVNETSASPNVDLIIGTRGNGFIRVENYSQYMTGLGATGNNDALVTKGYVSQLMGGETGIVTAGVGLTDENGTFNVNLAAETVKADTTGNLIVGSNATEGHVLKSVGTAGQQAVWGPISLANPNSFAGSLVATRGGTGLSEIAVGSLLVGATANTFEGLAVGSNNTTLSVKDGALSYAYVSTLYDTDGRALIASGTEVENVNAWLTVSNAEDENNVVIGTAGTRVSDNIGITLATSGEGLVSAVAGYTDNILPVSSKETFITKGYLEASLSGASETYLRRAELTTDWSSVMSIGEVTPVVAGGFNLYLTRVMLQVVSPITGGGVANASVTANGIAMTSQENDITEAGIYIVDLPQSFVSQETQIEINFFQADGTTPATPTGGEVIVTANYVIR